MGKPIVSTDADGLSDILSPGRDSLVVPRRDGTRAGRGHRVVGARTPAGAPRLARRRGPRASATASTASCAGWSGCTTCCTRPRGPRSGGVSSRPTCGSSPRTRRRSMAPDTPRARRTLDPGYIGCAVVGLLLLGFALGVDFQARRVRLPERRRHLLLAGLQPRPRLRLRLRAQGPRAGLARVPDRPGGHLPQEGEAACTWGPRDGSPSSGARRPDTARRSPVLREVVRAPAVRRARSSCSSAPTGSWCCTRSC